jgi:hypothetical protein
MVKEYKILAFSDMHGNLRSVDIAKTILDKDDYDLVIYLGDYSENVGNDKMNLEDAEYLVKRLRETVDIKALFGNCDTKNVKEFLEEQGISLHNKLEFFGKTAIIGWGGSSPTPFHTPSEFSEIEIEEGITKLLDEAAEKGAERLILFTHEPPEGTKADEIESGHVGSKSLRFILEKYQPNLNVCGHIHEAKSVDHVGDSKIVNIGPAMKGHFLSITIDGDIKTEEINI